VKVVAVALLLLFGASACSGSGSDSGTDSGGTDGQLSFEGVWSRPTPGGATNGVVYLAVTSPVDDAIVGVSVSPAIAASAELHETMGATVPPPGSPTSVPSDGQMTMAPLAEVTLPAGEAVLFEAGGKHIMLNDLAAPLVEGQTFVLTFSLRTAGMEEVIVVVTPNPPA
jgi:copper(I)-binding protein